MIRNIAEENEKVTLVSREMEGLREYFPQCFNSNGEFDIEKFREAIQPQVDVTREGRSYDFLGKSYARMLSSLDTTTVIRPDVEHNSKPENQNSENIYISGDNLDALHHLVKSYAGQVKCIYIDPPYNTGTDGFVYNDKFKFTAEELENKLSISSDEAEKIIAMTSGHRASHAAWLTFMMPRLQLARDLMSKDGVIFISIDDNEQAYLKQLCDNIFGEDNFVAQLIWEKAFAPKNDAKYFSDSHDYILVYARNIENFSIGLLPRTDEANARYKNPDNDPKGPWTPDNMTVKTYSASYDYPITTPNGTIMNPPNGRCWFTSKEKMQELINEGRVWFGENGGNMPRLKRYLSDVQQGMTPITIMKYTEVGHNQEGRQELKQLFGGDGVFDGPKPVRLLKRLMTLANLDNNSFVVDFFGGSSSTADAIMQINAKEGKSIRYCMVQWQEKCKEGSTAYKAGYRTIDEIGMERIKRAAKKSRKRIRCLQATWVLSTIRWRKCHRIPSTS